MPPVHVCDYAKFFEMVGSKTLAKPVGKILETKIVGNTGSLRWNKIGMNL